MQNVSMVFNIVVAKWTPWTEITEDSDGNPIVTGVMDKVVRFIFERMNAKFKYIFPTDKKWGTRLSNGTWTGIVGSLYRNESDLAIGPLAITTERLEVIDFSAVLYSDPMGILSVIFTEKNFSEWWTIFGGWKMTTCVGISYILIVLIGCLCEMSVSKVTTYGYGSIIVKYMTIAYRPLFAQSIPTKFSHCSQRILLGVWWLSVVSAVLPGFVSNSISKLSVVPRKRIKNFHDLLTNDRIRTYIEEGGFIKRYLESSSLEDVTKLLNKASIIENTFENLYSDFTMTEVLSGKVAIIDFGVTMKSMVDKYNYRRQLCGYYYGTETGVNMDFSIGLRKSLEGYYKDHISRGVMTLAGSSLINVWLSTISPYHLFCEYRESENREALALSMDQERDFLNTWFALSLFLSSSCLAIEFIVNKY